MLFQSIKFFTLYMQNSNVLLFPKTCFHGVFPLLSVPSSLYHLITYSLQNFNLHYRMVLLLQSIIICRLKRKRSRRLAFRQRRYEKLPETPQPATPPPGSSNGSDEKEIEELHELTTSQAKHVNIPLRVIKSDDTNRYGTVSGSINANNDALQSHS